MERTMNIHKSENEKSIDIVTAEVSNFLTKRVSYRDLDGWPTDSVILINSIGIGHAARAKVGSRECYEAAIDILKPSFILRYGARQEDERTEISRYYPNNNKMFNLFR